ncbi:MAG: hypothetical protein M3Y27_01550 [Acidobacteriota bacterium]|nr:hypothetical protein [Acidobacteriota bacterium]
MQDRLLSTLQSIADVALVSSLKDDRLGFPDKKDLRVFIPDLHLISEERRKTGNFKFGTNNEELLTKLLGALKELKLNVGPGEQVNITHLGDVLDLWREVPFVKHNEDTAAKISNDHAALINALRDPDLDATIFYGNHDFELYEWASYEGLVRRVLFPEHDPRVLVVHGDIFDWVESLPDLIQEIPVYLFAPGVEKSSVRLGQIRQDTTPNPNNTEHIKCPTPALVCQLRVTTESVPERFNVLASESAPATGTTLFPEAVKTVKQINSQYNYKLNTIVIGHTHHARIVTRTEGDILYTLIDCGAWIEDCVSDGEEPQANSQIAALCGNEVRVYQLRPK